MTSQHRRFVLLGWMAASWGMLAGSGHAATAASGPVVLRIYSTSGQGKAPNLVASYDMAFLRGLPQKSFSAQTPWFTKPVRFTGPLLRDVLAAAKVSGKSIQAVALDEYKAAIPFADAQQFDMVLAHQIDGQTLTPKDKGPLFVVYPYDSQPQLQSVQYYGRSVWQLKSLLVE